MIICMITFTLYPYITAFPALIALTAVFGLGESMVTSSTAAMVAEQTKASGYGTSMGVFGSLWDIGHASGPILTGLLLTRVSYSQTFMAITLILLIATALFQVKVHEPRR
jgi:MFS family permease